MTIQEEKLDFFEAEPEDFKELEYDHLMDISGSVFARMKELGLSQKELAQKMDMDPAQISRILKGKQNLTIRTLAKLEEALDFRLDAGFCYCPISEQTATVSLMNPFPTHNEAEVLNAWSGFFASNIMRNVEARQ